MKFLSLFTLSLLASAAFSQQPVPNYINSGSISRNYSCGIGEIFVSRSIVPPSPKKKEVIEDRAFAYPNPVDDVLTINASSAITLVRFYSLDGRLVMTQTVDSSKKVAVGALPPGRYLTVADDKILQAYILIKR